jgi:hypothetical protein
LEIAGRIPFCIDTLRQIAIAHEFTGQKSSRNADRRAGTVAAPRAIMMDLIFAGATGAFFLIALAYVWGCIRL